MERKTRRGQRAPCDTPLHVERTLRNTGLDRSFGYGRRDVYEIIGDDDGVFGCISLLGCKDTCPKELPHQTQIAFLRHKQGRHLGKMEALGFELRIEASLTALTSVALSSVLHKARLWQRINPHPVNERQQKVINRMFDDFKGQLTTSKYAKLAKCSNDTALRDIRELLARGIIVKNPGGGRSTSYRPANPD